ncbi:cation efflux family protein family [Histoplasma capsulatum var. duboisii H88]|uniref:Zinc transporter n=1 Tax=Ajellomyces capsulatus (strain H88) TaxID=544711 RepID=F0UAQ0_AJEC8|nr:cation efflux family protein family [Histoplasma capsulatum var. duboisii H88]
MLSRLVSLNLNAASTLRLPAQPPNVDSLRCNAQYSRLITMEVSDLANRRRCAPLQLVLHSLLLTLLRAEIAPWLEKIEPAMADTLPLPIPPRTPTPPSDDHSSGPEGYMVIPSMENLSDRNTLSPMVSTFGASGTLDPSRNSAMGSAEDMTQGPFNFKPTALAKSPVAKSNVGQRRGHKYKHSSVSHQIFLEPPPRSPMPLPNSLPIPTWGECLGSMSKDQRIRFWWSVCHMGVAGYTLWTSHGSMAMTGLSHLILFDSLGAMLCVVVDVLGNFEVWKRSSIRHPFGLERAEVVAGFALSVLLFFMGGDLISHTVQHLLENSGHEAHYSHSHARVAPGSVDITALLAIMATLISAIALKNHARIGKAIRFAYIESLPSILSNPAHFLTLSCSTFLLLLPYCPCNSIYGWIESYPSPLPFPWTSEVLGDIYNHPAVSEIEEAKFWQAHYGLCIACIKLRVTGSEESLTKLRERIVSTIKNRLGGGYGTGGQKWEVSLQFTVEQG